MGKKIKRSALNRIVKEETQRYFLEKRVKQKLVQEGFLDEEVPAPIDFGDKPEPIDFGDEAVPVHPLDDGDYGEMFYNKLLAMPLQRRVQDPKYSDPEINPKYVSKDNKIGGVAIAKAYELFKKTGYEEITPDQADAELRKTHDEYRDKSIKAQEEDHDDWYEMVQQERVWRAMYPLLGKLMHQVRMKNDEKYAREKEAEADWIKSQNSPEKKAERERYLAQRAREREGEERADAYRKTFAVADQAKADMRAGALNNTRRY